MKFNHRELAMYASTKLGKADKEGCLWMKEYESKGKKKQHAHVHRWFILSGNMLFYCRTDIPDSSVEGLIILERCQVVEDKDSENRNSFKLVFEDCDLGYHFVADSAKDQDEWSTALNSGSYEYLRLAFSELRGQLMHLTGQDPLVEDHPLGTLPIKNVSPVPASAPAYEGDPVFELTLACSSLVGSLRDGVPSAMIVTSCMTPPQAYWIRYAQTEVIEHSCDPRFFTSVVFYMGSISLGTWLKFEVFDVYDRQASKMCPIGQTQCHVMELIRSPNQQQRLEVIFDGGVCGYLVVRACKCQDGDGLSSGVQTHPLLAGLSAPPTSSSIESTEIERSSFHFMAPMENIVIRTFQFPVFGDSEDYIKVTEVMGEGRYSFSIPMQLLDMYIGEESELLSHYHSLTGLCEDMEIAKQDVMYEHKKLVQHYRVSKSGLQAQLEAGITFKKSTSKSVPELDFVPVNLHIQQMKVTAKETENKDKVVYTAVTAGCPTAYSLKFKSGGLARMQVTSPMANLGSFSPSAENKAFRAQSLIVRISSVQASVHLEADRLRELVCTLNLEMISKSMRAISDRVHQLSGHCNITLVNDALRAWYDAMNDPPLPSTDINAGSLCHKVEELVFSLEGKVDTISAKLVHTEDYSHQLDVPLKALLSVFDEVVSILKKALYFLLLSESYHLMEKVPIGFKSYRHRRDIVFSQAVTVVVTSFVVRLLQSVAISSFLGQLMKVGFLVHWESLLSTHGDENGMLEDFIVAIHDLNNVKFKLVLADSLNDIPKIKGSRYKVTIEIPVQKALFRVLPPDIQRGSEIDVLVVLFTQGINEQQSLADRFGSNAVQDQINMRSLQQLTSYFTRYKEYIGSSTSKFVTKCQKATHLLECLRTQVHSRKDKNIDILSLSQELCRTLDCGRVISCKSAKDRTAMSVTLEQAHILVREMNMDNTVFQQALDAMRSQGTRIRNTEKNVGVPLYAFNALQVFTLPPVYRPPDGTYKKLQT